MSKRVFLTLSLLTLTLVLAASSYAAIGVYGVSAGTSVPASVSYTLNTDANDTTGGWSVKIEIVPAAGGAAVRTWTFTYPDPLTLRGKHLNAVTWDGKTDGGTGAPLGQYRAKVSAHAAAVTGTDLVPLWEQTQIVSTAWTDVAVNNNPGSPYEGYVYAANYGAKGVYMFDPAGNFVKVFPAPADLWTSSAPWGVQVADDDKVWASSYSRSYVVEYAPDGTSQSGYLNIGAAYNGWKNPRFFDVTGAGGTLKTFATYWGAVLPAAGRVYYQTGYPPASPWNEVILPDQWNLMECKFAADGTVWTLAYSDPGAVSGGALVQYNSSGVKLTQNNNIQRGTGIAFSPGGNYVWISRFVGTGNFADLDGDSTAIYKIPTATALTTANPYTGVDVEKFGIANAAADKRAYTLDADSWGNLAAAAGNPNCITANPDCRDIGLYAPPDNGSTAAVQSAVVNWSEATPTYVSDNSPQSISPCSPGATAHIEVTVSDLDGYTDIQRCYLDLSPFGQADHTPMNLKPGSGSGTTVSYQLDISVPETSAVGDHKLNVYVRDVHYPAVAETVGQYLLQVAGAWIAGTVTNADTGWPVADATVEALQGTTVVFTATTEADGTYVMPVTPGSYTINAHNTLSYQDSPDAPTAVTVICGQTATGINRTLLPLTVRGCTGGNARAVEGRPSGQHVCVRGIVYRAAQNVAGGVANGLNGFYYIYDTKYQGTVQGCRVNVFAGQSALHEGDEVVVEGDWVVPYALLQGQVVPTRAPAIVATGKAMPAVSPMNYYTDTNSTYGRIWSLGGTAINVGTDRFDLQLPTSSATPTLVNLSIRAVTPASTGIVMPAENQLVDVVGINVMMDAWGGNQLLVGKPSDVSSWAEISKFADIKRLSNRGVIFDATVAGGVAPIVSYLDPGENQLLGTGNWAWVIDPDRASGLKIDNSLIPPVAPATDPPKLDALVPGGKVLKMKGRLTVPTDGARLLQLVELPTYQAGQLSDIPSFLAMPAKAFGGGYAGGTPGVVGGIGLNTDGLLIRVAGTASGYGTDGTWEWFYLDDGSGIVNEGGHIGIKVLRILNPSDFYDFPYFGGEKVIAEGICTSKWVSGAGRIPILKIRYDGSISDQVQILP